jgi:hypothetical protein
MLRWYTGTFDANDNNLRAEGFQFFATAATAATVYMGSGTWEVKGDDDNALWLVNDDGGVATIVPETSIIKFVMPSPWGQGITHYSNPPGASVVYNDIWFTGVGIGDVFITGNNTFNDLKIDAPRTVIFKQLDTTTVTTFTAIGTLGNLITLDSLNGTDQFTLSKASGIINCDYLNISNSIVTGGAAWYAGSHSIDGGNNIGWIWELSAIQDATQAQNVDNIVLYAPYFLAAGDASQFQNADNISLTQNHILTVSDVAQAQTSDNVTTTQHYVSIVQDSIQTQTSDKVTLVQNYILTLVNNSIQLQTVGNIIIGIGYRYWVGGTGNWNSASTHWAVTTGGEPATAFLPTKDTDVIIDSNSGFSGGGAITLNTTQSYCKNLTCNSGHTYTITAADLNYKLNIYGNLVYESGMTLVAYDTVMQPTNESKTITTNSSFRLLILFLI